MISTKNSKAGFDFLHHETINDVTNVIMRPLHDNAIKQLEHTHTGNRNEYFDQTQHTVFRRNIYFTYANLFCETTLS